MLVLFRLKTRFAILSYKTDTTALSFISYFSLYSMKNALKRFFTYSNRDMRGILVLTAVLILVLFVPMLLKLSEVNQPTELKTFEEEIELYRVQNLKQESENKREAYFQNNQKTISESETTGDLFQFNPNELNFSKAKKLGLSDFVAKNIEKYLNNGGSFKMPNDLKIIYGLSADDFERLEPYMVFETSEVKTAYRKDSLTDKLKPFNPNTISLEQALMIGIPPKVANSMIGYREKVGSFKQPEDFKKLYGLSEEDFQKIRLFLVIETPESISGSSEKSKKPELIEFDPNTVSKEQAISFGLSPKVAQTLINYRNSGGKFKQPEDFKKIYGLSESDFLMLLPFIVIMPDSLPQKANAVKGTQIDSSQRNYSKFTGKIDINDSTIEDWDKLPGIGTTYATMITKYRKKLGGFIHINQVKETYGLPAETYEGILPQLVNESPHLIEKINLNTTDEQTLIKHPYISKAVAQSIVNMRLRHGKYKSVEGIKKSKVIDQTLFDKISPYLSVE